MCSGCSVVGYGPVPAVKKALARAKMKIEDIELFEGSTSAAPSEVCVSYIKIIDIKDY